MKTPEEIKKGLECWINDAGHFSHTNDITHWMPLPEPPKEG